MRPLLWSLVILTSLPAFAQTWADRIEFGGDIRFRHDYQKESGEADRHRERLRLRLKADAAVSETMKLKLRIATGDAGDPISTNTTLTDNASKKPVYIDLATLDWMVYEGGNLKLGKMENPLRLLDQSQLIYDADYTPEGAAFVQKFGGLELNLAAFSIQERGPQADGTSEPDSYLLAAQLAYRHSFPDGMKVLAFAGMHAFTSMADNTIAQNRFWGNSESPAGRYDHEYQVVEVGGELSWSHPVGVFGLFADAIRNVAIDEENQGLLMGTRLTYGKWAFAYAYLGIDKDATVSALNNSDWGSGMDGGFGHMGQLGYAFNSSTKATLTWHHMNVDDNGAPYGTERAFADLVVTF